MPPARPLLVVDAANVIGSRPDGWWRDRAGAVRRLHTALANRRADGDDVVLVLEGAARRGLDSGLVDGIQIVHAPRSGDDKIVDLVTAAKVDNPDRPVTVVTADRELRDRVAALGAATLGTRTLWDRLES